MHKAYKTKGGFFYMKKIIGIAAVAAIVATSAFAEITFGAWGRAGIDFGNVVGSSTTTDGTTTADPLGDATVSATPSWASGSRVGFSVAGTNEDKNVGFNINVDSNGNTIGVGDQAKIWGQIGWFKAQFGKIQLDELRGSIGDWGNREEFNQKAEDGIFDRFYPTLGMTAEFRPIDGLFIGATIDASKVTTTTTTINYIGADVAALKRALDDAKNAYDILKTRANWDAYQDALEAYNDAVTTSTSSSWPRLENVLKSANVGVGYTIKDVAQIKAAYFGNSTDDHYGKLEFGADLLMIKNNLIEIGAKLPMSKDNADGYFNACVGFSGSADKLTYKGHVFGDFVRRTDSDGSYKVNPTAGFDACAEYDIGVCSLGLTGAYTANMYSDSSTGDFATHTMGLELYAKKGFANGYLFGGVADGLVIATASQAKSTTLTNTFKIPVGVEYSF
jgi:hypothetical protein